MSAENKFTLGKLSVTPGVRLKSNWQSVNEPINMDKTAAAQPLADETQCNFVPRFGPGLEYSFTPTVQAYANVSQAYRPPIFTQAIPTTPNTVVGGVNNLFDSLYYTRIRSDGINPALPRNG